MIRLTRAMIAALGLAACNGQPLDGGLGGPKMVDAIPNGVQVAAAPITYFHQGVRGGENRPASISTAQFIFLCDPNATGSLQERANASAQYSKIAREKLLFWLVNPRVLGELKREVHAQSVPNQACAVKDIVFTQTTTDPLEVAKFTLKTTCSVKLWR